MNIAVIIIHYGDKARTARCLQDLRKKIGSDKLVLINNTETDIQDLVRVIPGTILIENKKNIGFAKAVNQGIKRAEKIPGVSGYFLMNNDLELSFGSIDRLKRIFIDKKSAGIVSPVLHHHGNQYDWGGKYSRWTGMVRHKNFEQKPKTVLTVGHVAGAAMLIDKKVVDKIGNFDERFFLYYEDLDYCLRAVKAGFTIHINPEVVAEHAVSAGSHVLGRTIHQWRSHLLFVIKHIPLMAYPSAFIMDFFYYPLLILKSVIFPK